jgi:predicted  nucleic acid-binding Zn-ribbon protein
MKKPVSKLQILSERQVSLEKRQKKLEDSHMNMEQAIVELSSNVELLSQRTDERIRVMENKISDQFKVLGGEIIKGFGELKDLLLKKRWFFF